MRDSSSVGQGGLVDNLERRSGSHSTLLRRLKFLASPAATSGVLSVPPRYFLAHRLFETRTGSTAPGICIIAVRVLIAGILVIAARRREKR